MKGAGGSLFDWAHARVSDPPTAKAAAQSLDEDALTRLQSEVYAALKAHPGGLTAQEIAAVTGVDPQSITPRLRPMQTRGFIVDSGLKRVPEGRTRAGIVWRVA